MMKTACLFLCLFAGTFLGAQDTIYKRSGERLVAKILEIGISEVKFKRFDNLDGPLFISGKNEIKKIRYASGDVDTFALVKETAPRLSNSKRDFLYPPGFNKVLPATRSGLFLYQGRFLSDRALIMMAENKNATWKNKELDEEIIKTRDCKTIQYATGFGGLGLGVIALAAIANVSGTANYSTNNSSNAIAAIGVIGAGLFIASEVVSINFKILRTHHANRVAELYNENYR